MPYQSTLSACDTDNIGHEFSSSLPGNSNELMRHQNRRAALQMKAWRETLDSQRVPKSAWSLTCEFDTRRAYSESLMTWAVTIALSIAAGTICALVIKHLNLL